MAKARESGTGRRGTACRRMGWKRPEVPFSLLFPPPRKIFSRRAWVSTRARPSNKDKIVWRPVRNTVVRVQSTIRNPVCLRAQMDGLFQTRGGAVTRARSAAPVEVRTRISRTETERLAKSSLRRDASRSLPRGGVVEPEPRGVEKPKLRWSRSRRSEPSPAGRSAHGGAHRAQPPGLKRVRRVRAELRGHKIAAIENLGATQDQFDRSIERQRDRQARRLPPPRLHTLGCATTG